MANDFKPHLPFYGPHHPIGRTMTLAELQRWPLGEKENLNDARKDIFTILEERGGQMEATQMAAALRWPIQSVRILLGRMAGNGQLRKVSPGVYRLTEKHEDFLNRFGSWPRKESDDDAA